MESFQLPKPPVPAVPSETQIASKNGMPPISSRSIWSTVRPK